MPQHMSDKHVRVHVKRSGGCLYIQKYCTVWVMFAFLQITITIHCHSKPYNNNYIMVVCIKKPEGIFNTVMASSILYIFER